MAKPSGTDCSSRRTMFLSPPALLLLFLILHFRYEEGDEEHNTVTIIIIAITTIIALSGHISLLPFISPLKTTHTSIKERLYTQSDFIIAH